MYIGYNYLTLSARTRALSACACRLQVRKSSKLRKKLKKKLADKTEDNAKMKATAEKLGLVFDL